MARKIDVTSDSGKGRNSEETGKKINISVFRAVLGL